MLDKAYDPQATEDDIYKMWEESGAFKADNKSDKEPFAISMPPPNATGQLHLGHAVMLALEDIFIRFNRMRGKEALWVPGTDHAAIATESVVIKKIQKEEKIPDPRASLGREELIKRIKHFVDESQDTIRSQIRKMGSSCDWSRERYTFDASLNRCVNEVFVKMYNDGLIYRGYRVVNWDTALQTTVSDDEIEYQDRESLLYTFEYLSAEQTGGDPLCVSTSRPETKLGDTAIIVHPDDKRYEKLVGKNFDVQWPGGVKINVTVIADHVADPEFGTGAIGCTPYHSKVDYEIWKRHKDEIVSDPKQVIGEDGLMTDNAGKFKGKKVEVCREEFVKGLKKEGRLQKEETYTQPLSISYRSKKAIEPLPKEQWFIDVNKKVVDWKGKKFSLKEVMQEVVPKNIKIIPDRFEKTYFQWIDNLQDWCISRQIWWGHQVPVWYSLEKDSRVALRFFGGKMKGPDSNNKWVSHKDYVKGDKRRSNLLFDVVGVIKNPDRYTKILSCDLSGKSAKEKIKCLEKEHGFNFSNVDSNHYCVSLTYEDACKKLKTKYVVQDPDTLDTWFSSGLWTWSTLIDPELTDDFSLSLEDLLKKSPDFQKFHPTAVMETGYDILFFWVARMILMTTYATGQVPFDTVYLHGLIRTREGTKMSKSHPETMIDPLDIIPKYGADALRLSMIVGQSPGNDSRLFEEKIGGYRNFVNKLWNASRFVLMQCEEAKIDPKSHFNIHYPDLSLADKAVLSVLQDLITEVTGGLDKYRLSEVGEKLYSFVWDYFCDWYLELSKGETNPEVLVHVLRTIVRLLHPYCPFVTEELWKSIAPGDEMLIKEKWPEVVEGLQNKESADQLQIIIDVITSIRSMRADQQIEQGKKVNAFVHTKHTDLLESQRAHIERLGRLESLQIDDKPVKHENSASTFLRDSEVHLSLEGLIDIEAEKEKLTKGKESVTKFLQGIEKKLSNKEFTDNAPEEVIALEKEKLESNQEKLKKIEDRLSSIS